MKSFSCRGILFCCLKSEPLPSGASVKELPAQVALVEKPPAPLINNNKELLTRCPCPQGPSVFSCPPQACDPDLSVVVSGDPWSGVWFSGVCRVVSALSLLSVFSLPLFAAASARDVDV